jgi:hypothetical protein
MVACVLCAAAPARSEDRNQSGESVTAALPSAPLLILDSDPGATPVEAAWLGPVATDGATWLPMGSGDMAMIGGLRTGCPDVGFTTRAYARDSGNEWPWLPANTLVADDLTLLPGDWTIDCYDVLIYADNLAAFGCNRDRTVTLRAYDACNGALIPGSQETWTVPPHGGPVLLTGASNVNFPASGTIWFGLTTSINKCDGWYIGQQQVQGSTNNVFQLGTDCAACINPPSCSPYSGFIVVLYGCQAPTITSHPTGGEICPGGFHQFCVNAQGSGTVQYKWQKDGNDISGATSPCYVATAAGSYRCVVTDSCKSVTSEAAALTVRTGPQVTSPPTGGVICSGQTRQVCVEAEAMGELHYQWKRGGLTLIGATSSCYYATAAGSYTCLLTDDCGVTPSPAALVTQASPSLGDFNGDGHVTIADWELLQPCMSGPQAGLAPNCACMDSDADVDADLSDFAALQAGFGD